MKIKKTGILLILCSIAYSAFADDVRLTLPEITNCGQYLEARRVNTTVLHQNIDRLVSWEWGYMSAYNWFVSQHQINIPDRPTILAFFDKYCADNPLKDIVYPNEALLKGLGAHLNGK